MTVISWTILIVFAVVGLAYTAREISFRLFCRKNDGTIIFITNVKKGEDAEFVLRSALSRLRWIGKPRVSGKICLDASLDDSARRICECVCAEYGFEGLISREELEKTLAEPCYPPQNGV